MDFLRFLACTRDPLRRFVWSRFKNWGHDPLRRFAWSRFKNWGLFTIFSTHAQPSAEIHVVEVQKFSIARDPLRRFAWSRCKNCGLFYDLFSMRARPSAEIRAVEVQKLRTFYDFCWPRATLCGDSHGRGSKTAGFLRFLRHARDLCEIRVVKVQKLRAFYNFCGATVCGDRARQSALAAAPCEFVLVSANPLRRLCVSKRSCWGPCLELSCGSRAISHPAVASCPRQLRLDRSFLSTNVVRGACSCSSGWKKPFLSKYRRSVLPAGCSSGLKIATFKYKRSSRSVLLQLRWKIAIFKYSSTRACSRSRLENRGTRSTLLSTKHAQSTAAARAKR